MTKSIAITQLQVFDFGLAFFSSLGKFPDQTTYALREALRHTNGHAANSSNKTFTRTSETLEKM